MKFKKGESGNPAGKPRGARDKRTALRELLRPYAPALVEKVVEQALQGDTTALKLCLDRLMPPLRPTSEPLPFQAEGDTLSDQARAVVSAMANGTLPPEQAATMITALAAMTRVLEIDSYSRSHLT
jgi:hypothetical protein